MNRRRFFVSSMAAAAAVSLPYTRLLAAGSQAAAAIGDGLPAVMLDGKATLIEPAAIKELRRALRGALLLRNDAGYDQARRVLNESIDKYPALVVRPSGVADIRHAVDFARERQLLLAVKCGGHSPSGKSTCDGGLQLDLSSFRGVRVDPARQRAWADGGSLLGDLDHETMAFGQVTTAGTVSHTGLAGLTLGGGFGRLARRFGLALDNVMAVDVVTADGRLVHASADENPDLLWGVRGGGGNFGVVTNFEFSLHPMQRQVIAGGVAFPLARAREVLDFYADFSNNAPDELYADYMMTAPRGGNPGFCLISVCYSGSASAADRVLAPLAKLGTPIRGRIEPADYIEVQRRFDQPDPRREGSYLKGGFINDFPSELIAAIVDGFEPDPGRGTVLFFQHSGGAIGRVPVDATAFPHRKSTHNMLAVVSWSLDDDRNPHVRYIKDYWDRLQPFTDGWYTNEVADETRQELDENYGRNLPRMRQLKKKYDPGNLFRLNANVVPAA